MFTFTDGATIEKSINYMVKLTKQIPYGTMLGVNQTAVDSQTDTYNNVLPKSFLLRNAWFRNSPLAFKIKFAKKDNLQAVLGSTADFMKIQEEGGTKTPQNRAIAIPTSYARPNKKDIIKGASRPRALFSKGKGFLIPKMSNGFAAIFVRLQKDSFQNRKGNIVPMYILKPNVAVSKHSDFIEKETAFVNAHIEENVKIGIQKAILDTVI